MKDAIMLSKRDIERIIELIGINKADSNSPYISAYGEIPARVIDEIDYLLNKGRVEIKSPRAAIDRVSIVYKGIPYSLEYSTAITAFTALNDEKIRQYNIKGLLTHIRHTAVATFYD